MKLPIQKRIRWQRFVFLLLTGLPLTFFSGCGTGGDRPELIPAGGVVTYQGKPLAGAQVFFAPQSGPAATGMTNEAGLFQLATRGEPGTVAGTHQVSITALEPSPAGQAENADNSDVEPPKSRIPQKYGLPARSGLTATVSPSAEDNQFTFELK